MDATALSKGRKMRFWVRLSCIAMSAFALGALFVGFFGFDDAPHNKPSDLSGLAAGPSPVLTNNADARTRPTVVANVAEDLTLRLRKAGKVETLAEIDRRMPVPDSMEVLLQYGYWANRAKGGDTSAMLALARTLQACWSFDSTAQQELDGSTVLDSTRCGNIPAEDRIDPLIWLERAAQSGDVRAMFEYGVAARRVTPASDGLQSAVADRAKDYLRKSAIAGLEDAIFALAESHRSGWYANPNKIVGVAYLMVVSELSPGSMPNQALERVLGELNGFERTNANSFASTIRDALIKKSAAGLP